ncbi:Transferase [Trema orientale]|uniref:Transferase n=1 Tax=Trema orientale TaxID=63057 RepID=A0A2P5FMV8_TREOI|nr:Transferase [Trema orientale]
MKVQISETTLVVPATPPFADDHVLPLSHIDNDPNLRVSFRYLRAYVSTNPSTPSSDPFHVISSALSAALVHYYPLAGSLRTRPDRRLELVCSKGQGGVPLVRAKVGCTLDSVSYLDDLDTHFVEQLVPAPGPDEGLAYPCMLQLTMFDCGGFTLGTAIHHSLADGLGATQFFNVMAEFARGATRSSIAPVWDRDSLLGPRDPPRVEAPIREFLSLDSRFSAYEQPIGPVVRECFKVRDECLDRFKSQLLDRSGLNFTTFEALGAFIWRAKVRASNIPADEMVKYAYSLDIRKLVKPPLPAGYWGNGCAPMYAKQSAKDLVEKPIWETAELIKKSKRNATDEYVRSFIDFQGLHYGEGITAGKEVSGFTDWRHLGHSTVDFGWGGPVTVLPLSRHLLGGLEPCYFLPYSSASVGKKDGFKISVTLRETAMPAFKKEMEKFCSGDFGL